MVDNSFSKYHADMAPSEERSISIVVPVHNAGRTLKRALKALSAMTPPQGWQVRIVFVDDASSDCSLDLIRKWERCAPWPVCVEQMPVQSGPAAARNRGAACTESKWIAFTDADCLPSENWLVQGCRVIESGQVDALAGVAWGVNEGSLSARLLGLISLAPQEKPLHLKQLAPTGVTGFPTANFWIRRDIFEEIGGFDQAWVGAGEDMDLCARVLKAGYTIVFDPQLRVRHIHTGGIVSMVRKAFHYSKAHGMLFERHGCPGLYLDVPFVGRKGWPWRSCPLGIWIQATSVDKKMLAFLMLGVWQPWLGILAALIYAAVLAKDLVRRSRVAWEGEMLGKMEAVTMVVLWCVRDISWTMGRLLGSSSIRWLA